MVPCELFLDNLRLGNSTTNVDEQQLNKLIAIMEAFEDKSILLSEHHDSAIYKPSLRLMTHGSQFCCRKFEE
jgi:hypothetical protein